jgi:hypothetical protein
MRLTFTLVFVFFFSFFSNAQKLKGIWRGYFVQQNGYNPYSGEFSEDQYRYEVQINQLANGAIEGVTYSYKKKEFYGKASFHGIFRKATKNVLIKEIKMLDLQMSGQSVACLMTCYLDYSKNDTLETLSGTYTSLNSDQKTDCGSGTLYLERVQTTDFEKESFLLNKKAITPPNKKINKDTTTITKKSIPPAAAKKPQVVASKPTTPKQNTTAINTKPITAAKKPVAKPGAESFIVPRKATIKKDSIQTQKTISSQMDTIKQQKIINKNISSSLAAIPKVLRERTNSLVKTIEIDEKQVQIDYYDNGEIDNDTITVYHNNELAINHGRLSNTPITLKIQLDEQNPLHELITVAENLGDIPPNTALMVITTPGRKRYEVFITSDEKTNAKVILEYKPKAAIKIH